MRAGRSATGSMNETERIGRFEVLDHLASGGMAHVYLARAIGLGGFERKVVIKMLDASVTGDDDVLVAMFLDEARLVGALHHQYIAPIYEVGCDDEGRYYFVMEYISGETAEAIWKTNVSRGTQIPLELALTVGSAVASALAYAHAACATDGTPLEIVHRDVSLSNVMVGHEGSVKLIDFGIAKSANRATKTAVGAVKGKIGYLAPEQIRCTPVDRRTDIFALGIVLYELTTTTRAFRDSSDLITFERITRGEIARPSTVIAGYPPGLERIVMRALELDPDDRFQDAGALARDLELLAASLSMSLGHLAIADAMAELFVHPRGRPRGSPEARTDVMTPVLDHARSSTRADDTTPVIELDDLPTRRFSVAGS